MADGMWDLLDAVFHITATENTKKGDGMMLIDHVWQDAWRYCRSKDLMEDMPTLHSWLVKKTMGYLTCSKCIRFWARQYVATHPHPPKWRTTDLSMVIDFAQCCERWTLSYRSSARIGTCTFINWYLRKHAPPVTYTVKDRSIGMLQPRAEVGQGLADWYGFLSDSDSDSDDYGST